MRKVLRISMSSVPCNKLIRSESEFFM
jgi:hypothetical protein